MKTLLSILLLNAHTSFALASDFKNSFVVLAQQISEKSQNIAEELSMLGGENHSSKFYNNEVVVKLQPELGVSVPGLAGLKFAFSTEYTITRKLPPNLEIIKP